MLRRFGRDQSTQSLAEYVLVIAVIAIALMGVLTLLRAATADRVMEISDSLEAIQP